MSDEPKRITEVELRIVEGLEEGNRSALLFARRLADEVRRLRRLIAGVDTAIEDSLSGSVPCGETVLYLAEQVPEFFREARAIREEQAVLPSPPGSKL